MELQFNRGHIRGSICLAMGCLLALWLPDAGNAGEHAEADEVAPAAGRSEVPAGAPTAADKNPRSWKNAPPHRSLEEELRRSEARSREREGIDDTVNALGVVALLPCKFGLYIPRSDWMRRHKVGWNLSYSFRQSRMQTSAAGLTLVLGRVKNHGWLPWAQGLMVDFECGYGGWKLAVGAGKIRRLAAILPATGYGFRAAFYQANSSRLRIADGTQYLGIEAEVRFLLPGIKLGAYQRLGTDHRSMKSFIDVGWLVWI